jgi:hypothetical protein
MDEVRIIQRGGCYLTPLKEQHIQEFLHVIHPENVAELIALGHRNIMQALEETLESSESYLARDKHGEIMFVGGLLFDEDESPQMFAMFSTKISDNFTCLARGSKMLINFFDQTYPELTMTISGQYNAMNQWAVWLGFVPVQLKGDGDSAYVEFVRCNPTKKNVSDKLSRPVMH